MAEAVVYVWDLERMTAFYEGCVGLRPAESGRGYRGLTSDDWTLWLVAGDSPQASRGSSPTPRRSATPIKLVFGVPSIAEAGARAADLGGSIDGRHWKFDGVHRRDGVDPEGNVIQLVEPTG